MRRVGAIPMIWRIEREAGPGLLRESCAVVSRGGDLTVRLSRDRAAVGAAWSVVVGFDNQPGSTRYVRVNKQYYTSDQREFSGAEASEIVALLKAPGEFAFEWAKAPNFEKRQGLYGNGDFRTKAAECERWVQGLPV